MMGSCTRRRQATLRWAVALTSLAALLLGCGVGSGGTGSFASGPITGFGSIVVVGVHFDESAARIETDDGLLRDAASLQLGMMVEVVADEVVGAQAQASQVQIFSALIGRVDAVDSPASRLTVNGLVVRTHAATVFEAGFGNGLAGVMPGDVVEIYGAIDGASGEVSATRIERSIGATGFKFRGEVSGLNRTARTFSIGTQSFDYSAAAAAALPPDLADGVVVRATVNLQRGGAGRWLVRTLATISPPKGEFDHVSVNGLINRFTSAADFNVQGLRVDATAAAVTGGPLARGQRVAVDGVLRTGTLRATRVSVRPEDGGDDFEMRGVIASVDAAARTFALVGRHVLVSFAGADIEYSGGDASSITVGRRVEVEGRLSTDGTRLDAQQIEFPK